MFAIGLAFGGRLFPFQLSDPLVFLVALAEWAIALPRVIAGLAGARRRKRRRRDLRVRQHLPDRQRPAERAGPARRLRPRDGTEAGMTTHLGVMILFAACVSVVFGALLRETPRDAASPGRRASSSASSAAPTCSAGSCSSRSELAPSGLALGPGRARRWPSIFVLSGLPDAAVRFPAVMPDLHRALRRLRAAGRAGRCARRPRRMGGRDRLGRRPRVAHQRHLRRHRRISPAVRRRTMSERRRLGRRCRRRGRRHCRAS